MDLIIAAIRSGTDPIGKLPIGSFHRWLEDPILCPKCDASYNLVAEWDQATNKFFPEASRRHIQLLKKAVFMGHSTDHRVTHFETSGVIVRSITAPSTAESKR